MSRTEEILSASRRATNALDYFKPNGIEPTVAFASGMVIGQLQDISLTLAMIYDKMAKQEEVGDDRK